MNDNNEVFNKVSLLLICGPPAIGKTEFTKTVESYFSQNYHEKIQRIQLVALSFDDLIDYETEALVIESNSWKLSRELVCTLIQNLIDFLRKDNSNSLNFSEYFKLNEAGIDKAFLSNENGLSTLSINQIKVNFLNRISFILTQKRNVNCKQFLICIDDNFYYESMRFRYYQVARDKNLNGFMCLFFKIDDLNELVRRNAQREPNKQVDSRVIQNIMGKFNYPDEKLNETSWQKDYLVIDGSIRMSVIDERIVKLILDSFEKNEFEIKMEEKRLDELQRRKTAEITAKNVSHQSDLVLRKMISVYLKGEQRIRFDFKTLNAIKSDVLNEISMKSDLYFYLGMKLSENFSEFEEIIKKYFENKLFN